MEDNTEYLKLPVEEQCVHKLWKARLHGYEEATKLFQQVDDEKSPEFTKYLGLLKKFVVDSNAAAQEKGLEAVLAFVENSASAGKTVGEVVSGIVAKCIAAPKAKTKDLALQITLMYIEIEKYETVQEELLKGMEHKNPKTVAACVLAMTEALREFGTKVINIKPLVKKVPVLLEDRDKTVRDEGKALVVEMYRWVGVALKPQLSALKPVQVAELESEFEKVKGVKAAPTRYLRSQQQKHAKLAAELAAAGDEIGDEDEEDGAAAEVDPYDLMVPVDILSKLPKDFYDKLEAKKWQERKEAVDSLEQLLQAPKLENGDYGDLVRSLKKIISKDTNVMVIAVAGKCLAALANGLKKHFQPYAAQCVSTILEKFREKKQNVVTALREAIDAVYISTTIEAIHEDCLEALENKNPTVKAETASFLARCFTKCTPMMLTKKLLKAYSTALLKLLNDPDPVVRDNAAEALGTAMKVVGEKAIMPFLADTEAIKMTKIKECCDKAVIVAKVPKTKVVERPASAPMRLPGGDGDGKSVGVKSTKKTASNSAKKPVKKAVASGPGKKLPSKGTERELTEEEVDEQLGDILQQETISGFEDANWKVRLAALEQLMDVMKDMDPADMPSPILIRALTKKPGLKDTNFQVLKVKLEALKFLAESAEISHVSVESCVTDVADKLADPKNGMLAAETLTALAEATKLDFVATTVLDFAFNQKNPKVQVEALNWVSDAIKEFGFIVQPKALMDSVRKAVGAIHPGVRSAGINFTGTLYVYIGQQLLTFFEGEKPALLQQITAECEKHEGEIPPAPMRGQKGVDADQVPEEMNINMQDYMEKVDISSHITDSILSELTDKNWKVRSEALQKLVNLVNEYKYITSNLGELPPILAQRLVDCNSKIAAAAIALCQSLGTAMGSQCKVHVRTLFPNFLQGLGDSKIWIRSAALACINSWGDQCGYKTFFDGEMIGDALKAGSPVLRSELWTWLAEKLPDVPPKSFPREELTTCLPHLFSNLEDRNADVRKSAHEAVPAFVIHLGYASMIKAAEKLKPSTQSAVKTIIMKVNVPVKQLPSSRSSPDDQELVKTVKSGGAKLAGTKTITKNKATAPAASKGGVRKKDEEADNTPLLQTNGLKNQRSLDEQKLKVLKWNFTSPREEFVDQLKDSMTVAGVNRTLMANMFHSDFKYHLKAIDMLNEDLPNNPTATMANLDLILKWMTLRFFDTNPSVILKGLEYLNTVFQVLIEEGYNMFDHEASSFVPYLILKIGDPKDAVRNSVKSLFKQIERIFPASKLFSYIMDGLKSKNARQRTECLELLGYLIEGYGLYICQPTPVAALKEIARQISDRDNSVRNAALNCVVQAYFIEGDKVYKMVGQISDKDLSLLEERIKRAAKNRPPSGVKQLPSGGRQLPQQQHSPPSQKISRQGSDGNIQREPVAQEIEAPPVEPQPRPSPPKPRPVSGRYGLDPERLAKIEGKAINLCAPKLHEFDLKDILGDAAPAEKAKTPYQNSGSPILYQPQQPRPVLSYAQASRPEEVIEIGISNVANPDVNVAWQACVQLEMVLQTDNVCYLSGKEDHLVLACVMQLRLLNSSSLHSTPGDLLCKGYRNLFLLLMSFFDKSSLAKRVSKKVLHDLVYQLLGLLVDRHLEELENGDAFVRVVNVMVMRIIENSDHTNITSAMIKSLHDCVASTNSSPRFTELVMKCLWRITKLLPEWEEETDFAIILYDIHLFLKDFPSPTWKKRSSDVPLRTIKTFIHTITKIKGNRILNYLGRIDNASDSELHTYLIKLLKNAKQDDMKATAEKRETKTQNRQAKVPYVQLSDIFKKIGLKNHTKEGLELLYNFKEQYPQANLELFLRKSSPQFQDYIAKGLKTIEVEKRKEQLLGKTNAVSQDQGSVKQPSEASDKGDVKVQYSVGSDGDGSIASKDVQYYYKRLRRLQADAGYQPVDIPLSSNVRQKITVSNENIPNDENLNVKLVKENRSEMLPVSRSSSDGVERLRKRLEALKSVTK